MNGRRRQGSVDSRAADSGTRSEALPADTAAAVEEARRRLREGRHRAEDELRSGLEMSDIDADEIVDALMQGEDEEDEDGLEDEEDDEEEGGDEEE